MEGGRKTRLMRKVLIYSACLTATSGNRDTAGSLAGPLRSVSGEVTSDFTSAPGAVVAHGGDAERAALAR